jgi:eukaryotic-like serine/threonine-protein kinase
VTSDLRDQLQSTLGGTYTLGRELGGGGMSRVFVADELRLGRKVAVKVLSPELAAGISAERFEREIRLAASLQQANIVPLLSAGDAGGLPFYTMPYVEGESLRTRLGGAKPLSTTEIISILRDVARALAYAHERGIVHRDIKPDNVLISGGTAVVTDFGIAKAISASRTASGGATLTQMGMSIGTPAYIAPEQAAGDPNVDSRADIYAFGCMAYELLAGHPPFHGRTPQRVLAAHMSEAPEPITNIRPDIAPSLADLVMRCLAKEPSERPASAGDVLRILDAVTSSDAVPAMPAILLGGRRMLGRALAVYVVAVVAVAILAKAAIVGIGLPDWVLPGSLAVMALGLPMILFTAYVQRVTRRAITSSREPQGTMATLALKATPHLSWRRTAAGGVYAIAAFVLLVGGYMALRALGIGPAGSLLARRSFSAREPVIIADFAVEHADSTLGPVVSDAVRAALSDSRMITLVSPADVAAELRRMQRSASTRLDLNTAREVAQRQGTKAVVDGSINGVGSSYIVTLRLVTADSAVQLASFQETGDGPRGLIDASDKLARRLRAKIGESLRSVQVSPPLSRATTSSLAALREYSAGIRANSQDEDPERAAVFARRALAIDSTFGSAWRLLSVALGNMRASPAARDSALEHAYRNLDRMTEPEQLGTRAVYFTHGPHEDRTRAMAAYTDLMERGDSTVAAVNAGEVLRSRREYARAESLNVLAIRMNAHSGVAYANAIELQLDQGKVEAAQRTLESFVRDVPTARSILSHRAVILYARNDTAALARLLDSLHHTGDVRRSLFAANRIGALAMLHGRIDAARRISAENSAVSDTSDILRLLRGLSSLTARAWFQGRSTAVVDSLDVLLREFPLTRFASGDRPYFEEARAYALAGDAAKADAIVATFRREVNDTAALRLEAPWLHQTLAEIALARGNGRAAIEEFRRADVSYDGKPAHECAPCVHINLARAFDAANEADSAIAHYEGYIATPYWPKMYPEPDRLEFGDPLLLAGTHKRLGELYEAKGDAARAVSHYTTFVELWKNADPVLQPKVAEARRKLELLARKAKG